MRILRVALLIFVGTIVVIDAHADQPHYYVLLEPGNYRCYCNYYGVAYCETVTGYEGDVSIVEVETYWPYDGTHQERWRMDANGDVWRLEPTGFPDGSPELWLDVPLTPGKSWSNQFDQYGEEYLSFTVEGPVMVNTMFGYLEGVSIHMDWGIGGGVVMGTYWYVDGYGLVKYDWTVFDAHFDICDAVIATESRTFSDVKSLFR